MGSIKGRSHCEDGAEAGFALGNPVVGLRRLSQWVRFDNGLDFSLRDEIKRFVKIFGAVLLAANYPNALYSGAKISERTLLPGNNARLGETRFETWVNQPTGQIRNAKSQPAA